MKKVKKVVEVVIALLIGGMFFGYIAIPFGLVITLLIANVLTTDFAGICLIGLAVSYIISIIWAGYISKDIIKEELKSV